MKQKNKSVYRNVLVVVLWLIVLAACLFPARYINSMYGYFSFLFFLVLFVLSLILFWCIGRKIQIETKRSNDHMIQCVRGEDVDLGVQIRNDSFFTCGKALASFYISNLFGEDDSLLETTFTLAGKSENAFQFDMDMKHIGMYQVGIKDIKVFDMFGGLARSLHASGDFEVYVKPRIHTMDELKTEEAFFLESSRETNHTVKNGTDYVGVREYELGDSMKSIHWKLSAHTIGYLTKISESNRQSDYSVLLDFAANAGEKEELMDLYDVIIETGFSLLEELAHREVNYSLLYCDKQQELHRSTPKSRANDLEYIRRFDIIHSEPDAGYPDGAAILEHESQLANQSTNLYLVTSRVTDEMIQQLISLKQQRRFPELYYVYPERFTKREREIMTAPLRILDDAKIPWHMISTALLHKETTKEVTT